MRSSWLQFETSAADWNSPPGKYSIHHDLNLGDICDFPRVVCLNTHYTLHSGMTCPGEFWKTKRLSVDTTGQLHDDDIWLQLPEFISVLLCYLNLSIPLRIKEHYSSNLCKKTTNSRILVVVVKWRHRAIVLLQITKVIIDDINPLGPKSVQHQFSPNNISRSTRVKVMRINKLMTKGRILWY